MLLLLLLTVTITRSVLCLDHISCNIGWAHVGRYAYVIIIIDEQRRWLPHGRRMHCFCRTDRNHWRPNVLSRWVGSIAGGAATVTDITDHDQDQ